MTAHVNAEASTADARALDALNANSRASDELRRQSNKRELRLAVHNLAEGVRGVIRVNPLAATLAGVAFGLFVARRRRAPKR